ncbi:MAG: STAS domain-containing protein [Bdellovibrionaceae bacterium]|nr:STAS domain-containing protein [Pseudobdellovibrionaceae bacterium]
MQAKVEIKEGVTVFHLSGRIDFEAADRFRETCLRMPQDQKLVFNLESLSFVGSCGITPFIETMQDLFLQNQGRLKLCRVGVEFRKVIESSKIKNIEVYEDVDTARIAFLKPPIDNFIEKPGEVIANAYMPSEYEIKD